MQYLKVICLSLILLFSLRLAAQPSTIDWEKVGEYNGAIFEVTVTKGRNACYGGDKWNVQYKVSKPVDREIYARWQVAYIDCDGKRKTKWFEVDLRTLMPGFVNEPAEGNIAAMELDQQWLRSPYVGARGSTIVRSRVAWQPSVIPESIIGQDQCHFQERVLLTIKGGQLNNDDQWIWYKDSCGQNYIGFGDSIIVYPETTTHYFVRAEGANSPSTDCIFHEVRINPHSEKPVAIKMIGTDGCHGNKVTLIVEGGRLGLNSKWVWYKGDCDGVKIDEGNKIQVQVKEEDVRYFVRAEGINLTDCVSRLVEGGEQIFLVATIRSVGEICPGEKVKLELNKNSKHSGQLHWYKDSCGSELVGVGKEIWVNPEETTKYFVRTENDCFESICANTTVKVSPKTIRPMYIKAPLNVKKGSSTTISVGPAGILGKNAEWAWYNATSNTFLGKGDSVQARFTEPSTIVLRSIGPCENASASYDSVKVIPVLERAWEKYNSRIEYVSKIMHWGFQFGLESNTYTRIVESIVFPESHSPTQVSQQFSISSLGINSGLLFYPIHTNYFGIGIGLHGYAGVPATKIFLSEPIEKGIGSSSATIHQDLSHFSGRAFLELTLGGGSIRLLGRYQPDLNWIEYRRQEYNASNVKVIEANYNRRELSQQVNIGLRMGRITTRTIKAPTFFDLYLIMQEDLVEWDDLAFNSLSNISPVNWRSGIGLSISWLNKVQLNVQVVSNSSLNSSTIDLNQPQVVAQFGYRLDRFY